MSKAQKLLNYFQKQGVTNVRQPQSPAQVAANKTLPITADPGLAVANAIAERRKNRMNTIRNITDPTLAPVVAEDYQGATTLPTLATTDRPTYNFKQSVANTSDPTLAPLVANDYQGAAPFAPSAPTLEQWHKTNLENSVKASDDVDVLEAELSNLATLDALAARTGEIDGRSREDIQREIAEKQKLLEQKKRTWQMFAEDSGVDPVLGSITGGATSAISGLLGAGEVAYRSQLENLLDALGYNTNPKYDELREYVDKQGGVYDALLPDFITETPSNLRQFAQETQQGALEGSSGLGRFALEGLGSITNLGTGAALSAATGIPLPVVMGLQAGGNAALDAKAQGATLDQQLLLGSTIGAATGLIESIGGIGASQAAKRAATKVVGGLMAQLPASITTWMNTTGAKIAGKILGNAFSEGIEEGIQYPVETFLQNLILDADVPYSIRDAGRNALLGATVGGLFGGMTVTLSTLSESSDANVAQTATQILQDMQAGNPQANQEAIRFLHDVAAQESIVSELEQKLAFNEPPPISVSAADAQARRRQIQQRNYATARETLSRMQGENLAIMLASDYLSSDAIWQMQQSGVMTEEIDTLLKAYNKAFQIQQRLNWLKNNNGNPAEIDRATRALASAEVALSAAQSAVANYLAGQPGAVVYTPTTTQTAQDAPQPVQQAAGATIAPPATQRAPQATPPQNATQTPQNATQTNTAQYAPAQNANIPTPETTQPGTMERGFSENVRTDTNMNPEIRQSFATNPETYTVLSNEVTLERAQKIFAQGVDAARSYLDKKIGNGKLSPEDVPLSRMIANDLAARGDMVGARTVVSDVASMLTEAGQLTQAANILRNADPISVQDTIQKNIDKINAELAKRGSKYRVTLTDAEIAEINATDFSVDGAYEVIYDKIARRIGAEMPSTLWEKLAEIRRISMLLNPKTQIRNIVGNVPLAVMRTVSEKMSGAIQDVAVKTGLMTQEQQTRTFVVSPESRAMARELFNNSKEALLNSSNKWDMNSLVRRYRKYFGNKGNPIDAVRSFTYMLLEKGDLPFLRSAFISNAAQMIEARGYKNLNNVPQEVVDFASQKALEATFRDASALAQLINQIKNTGGLGGKALDVLMPFTTTPINIAKRTYEYSPLGAIKVVSDIATRKGAATIIDDITKTATGTAVVALGVILKSLGAITGARDDDPDKAAFDLATGINPYSFFGKVAYDWMQPVGSLLAMGASVYDATQDSPGVLDAIVNTLTSTGDAFLGMTFFKSIIDLFNGYGSVSENIGETLINSGLSQFAPSVFGSLARTLDPTVRTAYTGGNVVDTALAGVQQKTPGASTALPASVNVKGEENTRIDNPILRALQEFINPANVNTGAVNEVDQFLMDLYDATGDKGIMPKVAPYRLDDGTQLTGEERSQYQTVLGQTYYDMLGIASDTGVFDALPADQQAEVVKDILEFATDAAKRDYYGDTGKGYSSDWDDEAAMTPDALATALAYKEAFNSMMRDYREDSEAGQAYDGENSEAFTTLATMYDDLTREQKEGVDTTLDNTGFGDVLAALDAGIPAETFFKAYDQYKALRDNNTLTASEQMTKLSYWLDTEMPELSSEQKSVLKEHLDYYSQIRGSAEKYETLTSIGLSEDDASKVYDLISSLQPPLGKTDVTAQQKYTAIAFSSLKEVNKVRALSVYMSESAYEKLESAVDLGVPVKDYVAFIGSIDSISGDGRKDRIMDIINGYDLTTEQKDALYFAAGYKESTLYKDAPWY